jgi:hypothetical protein
MLVARGDALAFSSGEINRGNQRFSAPRADVSTTAPWKNALYKNALAKNDQCKSNLCR